MKNYTCVALCILLGLYVQSNWKVANNKLILILISKSKCMLFQNTQSQVRNRMDIVLHGNKIENVDHFKFLGIRIDKNLKWKKYKWNSRKCLKY